MFFGLFLYSLGWTFFLIPAGIKADICLGTLILFHGFRLEKIFCVNAFLVVIAIKILGASFGTKTIVNMALISVMLTVLPKLLPNAIIDDTFLAAVLGEFLEVLG